MKKKINILFLFSFLSLSRTTFSMFHQHATKKNIKSLSLKEKIGQLFIVEAYSDPKTFKITNHQQIKKLIKDYFIGGIIFLGKGTPETQVATTNEFQKLSKTPLLIALDAEWGLSMRLKNTLPFPRNGALNNIDNTTLYQLGKEIGRQLSLIGVHMNLAPVVDVNNNPRNPIIGNRSFGDNPQLVAQKGIIYMQGLADAGIIACAKHFPGHGDTTIDSHKDLPIITHTRNRLDKIELYPFKRLIKKGVPAIMTAHLAIPALEPDLQTPSSLSYNIVTKLLKNKMAFKGLIITDSLSMQAVRKHHKPGFIELKAFLAGNDILLCPLDVPKASALIENAIKQGVISEKELDRRVTKIMQAKAWAFTQNPTSLHPVYDYKKLHTKEAYALQKKLYDSYNAAIPKN